ncbi:MAG TPA: hypothetical protein PLO26_01480, partial [Nitrosomonas europaea]
MIEIKPAGAVAKTNFGGAQRAGPDRRTTRRSPDIHHAICCRGFSDMNNAVADTNMATVCDGERAFAEIADVERTRVAPSGTR